MEEDHNSTLGREDKILAELKQLKRLFTVLMGTEDLPAKEKFSRAALSKAASEFKRMQAARGEWVSTHDIDKVIKSAGWGAHKIIIESGCFRLQALPQAPPSRCLNLEARSTESCALPWRAMRQWRAAS